MSSLGTVLLALGVAESALLALALATRPQGPAGANRVLAALLAAVGGSILVPLLAQLGLWAAWPRAILLLAGTPLLFGPLLVAYVAVQTGEYQLVRGRFLVLHLLLPAAYLGLVGPLLLLAPAEIAELLQEKPQPGRVGIVPVAKYVSFLAYCAAALWLQRRFELRLRERLAELNPYGLGWLRTLVLSAVGLMGLLTTTTLISGLSERVDVLFAGAASVLVLALGAHGLRQPDIFLDLETGGRPPVPPPEVPAPQPPAAAAEPASEPADDGPAPPRLDPETLAAVAERLRRLGEEEALLFDPLLDLGRLARGLRVTPHQLSYALNQGLGRSFYEHVNALRVAAVQQRMADPAEGDTPVLDLAFRCGFTTKSTFNRAFKDASGTTPTAWRKGAGRTASSRPPDASQRAR